MKMLVRETYHATSPPLVKYISLWVELMHNTIVSSIFFPLIHLCMICDDISGNKQWYLVPQDACKASYILFFTLTLSDPGYL